jgi:hypothetical protein
MKCAYEQGREEAIVSFKNQRSQMQRKIDGLVDDILETYKLGIALEIFREDPGFVNYLKDIKMQLQSLYSPSSKVSRTSPLLLWLQEQNEDVQASQDEEMHDGNPEGSS